MSAPPPSPRPSPFPSEVDAPPKASAPTPISPLPPPPASGQHESGQPAPQAIPEPLPPSDAVPPGATPGVLPPPSPKTRSAAPPPSTALPQPAPSAARKEAAPGPWEQGWKRSALGLLLAVGLFIANGLWDWLRTPPPGPPFFPPTAWKEQGFEGVFLTTPLELGPTEEQTAKPREAPPRGAPRVWKAAKGAAEGGAFQLHLMRIDGEADPPLQADLLTQSLVAAVAYRMGDADPRLNLTPDPARGGDGWRGAYRRDGGPEPTSVEALGLRRGQVYWYVQVVFVGDRFRTDARRLLDSVRFAGGD